ncbi:MAG: hypothetical protein VX257_05515 [Planctomycetota bacterium]|nr:hypothetical protein [Planctomycetota bacterium]
MHFSNRAACTSAVVVWNPAAANCAIDLAAEVAMPNAPGRTDCALGSSDMGDQLG